MLHTVRSLRGLVSAPHPLAAEAGRDVLAEGGNAVEAMVAAAATIAVVYPHMTGIGGDGFWLIQPPGDPDPIAIDAAGGAAALARPEAYAGLEAIPPRGPRAALTVAGTVAGWAEALRLNPGRLPFARLMAPAIAAARGGIIVTRSQAALAAAKRAELAPVPGFTAAFDLDGGAPGEGRVQRLPDLAATLERLAEAGPDDFYRGALARILAAGLEAAGSPLRLPDLEACRARVVRPLALDLPEGRVWNLPPPTQGVAALMILGISAHLAPARPESAAWIHGLVEATKRAFLWRNAHLGDPLSMHEDPAAALAPARLRAEAAAIDPGRAAPWPPEARPGDTVWLGAVDGEGRVVSFIQSLYWEFGSGVVPAGTGVVWQNRGAGFSLGAGPNRLVPGRRPFHTLNPALARLADGRRLAYGTMGGEGQPQTQAALFSRHVRHGQDLQAAVTAPRWLLGRTWGAPSVTLKLESRFGAEVIDALAALGHGVETVEPFSDQMGHAGMVAHDPASGISAGAADPRADGAVAAL